MSVAQYVADTLRKHQVKATFFLANEKTNRGDMALDDPWKNFCRRLQQEGHSFGSHTMHHAYFQKDGKSQSEVILKPQFGPRAGKAYVADQLEVCHEIKMVNQRFYELTGANLKKIWRAPGGKTSPRLIQMGNACGFKHIGWAPTGFLGDELSSSQYSNEQLLKKSLEEIKDGDVTMAHLGIWSRKDPWALGVLDPLIVGLKAQGFCFATID
jgi:peptidoglycan/xylan/chitin deacetylase (PgdA/CDA1 family)